MIVCIALGSNLGNRLANLQGARDRLVALESCSALLAQASIYESAPIDCPDGSGAFLNTVISIEWNDNLLTLLKSALAIELKMGRVRTVQNAPRPVDIDLICAEQESLQSPELKIPHPRLHERRFVLEPLTEIQPDLVLPGFSVGLTQLLGQLDCSEQALEIFLTNW